MPSRSNQANTAIHDIKRRLTAVLIVAVAMAGFGLLAAQDGAGGDLRHFDIKAKESAYDPPRLVVRQGDRVRIKLASADVVHGFFLEGQDLDAVVYPGRELFNVRRPASSNYYIPMEEVEFQATRFGKFRYRCSVTCGTLHAFMQGEIIVKPNYPYWIGMGAALGVLLAGFFLMVTPQNGSGRRINRRLDLIDRYRSLKWLLQRRWLQFGLVLPGLGVFLLFMIAGFWGSPIGNRNIVITFVWILWWFLLIALLIPFGARIWCMACPIPFFGEWYQRKRLIATRPDVTNMWRRYRRWPAVMSNIWIQNVIFLMLCTFCAILVTRPAVTAAVLLALVVVATALSAVYRQRSFCNYLCPVSGFLSLYAMAALVEIRPRNIKVCRSCRSKACAVGSSKGWGCPWSQIPARLQRNNYCGMCMECIKTCSNGNMTLNLRPFCSDTDIKGSDEAWKAFIMVSVALVYSITLLGPWGTIKSWANVSEVGNWHGFLVYAAGVWGIAMLGLPGLWALACWAGRRLSGSDRVSLRTMFLRYSFLLVPVGLMAWIAFSVPLIMVNVTHVLVTLSDPLGLGWNLFGTGDLSWKPLYPAVIVYIQLPLLLVGLIYALIRGYDIGLGLYKNRKAAALSLLPVAVVCMSIVMAFITLYAG